MIEPAFLDLTADIVSAFVGKNSVRPAELPELIAAVHASLAKLGDQPPPAEEPAPDLKPAVPIRRSVTPDHIISLEDGRRLKSMKRYLAGLGMTPETYRAKWALPADYPMVAPNYAAHRSELARANGLSYRRQADADLASHTALTPVESEPATLAPVVKGAVSEQPAPEEKVAKNRGRPKKVRAVELEDEARVEG